MNHSTRLLLSSILLALAAAPAHAETGWKESGSGPGMSLTLEAGTAISLKLGDRGTPLKLILKCHDRKLQVGLPIGFLNRVPTVRFDGERAFDAPLHHQTKSGGLFTNERTVVDPDTQYFDKPAEMLGFLLRHQRMLLQLTLVDRPSQETTFELSGLEPQLAALEQACGVEKPIERPSLAAATRQPLPSERPGSPPREGAPEQFGEWTLNRSISKIDDGPVVILSLKPSGDAPASETATAIMSGRGTLVLRCRERLSEAFLLFKERLSGVDRALAVQASVDGGPFKEWWLSSSTDGASFFFSSAPGLLKRLLASRELRLVYGSTKPKDRNKWLPQGEVVFSLTGLEQGSKEYLTACSIDLAKVKVKDGLAPLP